MSREVHVRFWDGRARWWARFARGSAAGTRPRRRLGGTPNEVDASRRWHRDLLVRFQAHRAHATGRPANTIADDMRAGRILDARWRRWPTG